MTFGAKAAALDNDESTMPPITTATRKTTQKLDETVVLDIDSEAMKYADEAMEWKTLNKLLRAEFRDWINRLNPNLFTGIRPNILRAMQLTFIDSGTVSYEGIDFHMNGKVPGELLAANNGDINTLVPQLQRLAIKRQLKTRAKLLAKLSEDYNPNMQEASAALELDPIMSDQDSSLATGAQSFLGNLHAKRSGEYIFARTGFKFLDRRMGGEWKPKALIIAAGGAGSGKTALWLDSQKKMAQGYTSKNGQVIQTASLFISLEMSKEDLMIRMVANELHIDTNEISSGEFSITLSDHSEWETDEDVLTAIEDKTVELQQLPMYVVDNGALTLSQIVYEIRKHVHKYNVRVVAIDYMQLVNHHPTGNDNQDLGDMAITLKELAKRENITIILLSQINRNGEGLDAIRDSGEVQAVADVVIQLIPDADETSATPVKTIDIGWWKNRYGLAGKKTPILFNGAWQKFVEG
jgi:replicative DNA helicase